MSSDPKKPFDAPPSSTPDLLQKDLNLDRRKRAPSFEQLQAQTPDARTEPVRTAVPRQPAVPPATVPARPLRDNAPTQQVPRPQVPPPGARPAEGTQTAPALSPAAAAEQWNAEQARLRAAAQQQAQARVAAQAQAQAAAAQQQAQARAAAAHAAAQPPAPARTPSQVQAFAAHQAQAQAAQQAQAAAAQQQAQARIAAQAQAQAAAAQQARAAAVAPRPPPPAAPTTTQAAWDDVETKESVDPRRAPPSPAAFAQHRAAIPQVTPVKPTQGAVVPEGGLSTPNRAQPPPPVAPPQRPAPAHDLDEPEPRTLPASFSPARAIAAPPAPPAPPKPVALPASLLVTQPGLPGPFAPKATHVMENPSVPQRPASMPELPALVPAASVAEAVADAPQFDEVPAAATDGTVTAEPASLWRRVGAWLSDLGFVSALVLAFLFVAMTVIAPKNLSPLQQLAAVAAPGAALGAILAFVYTTLFAFLWNGRTPGRRLFGIHLVDTTGHAPAPFRALVRAALSLVSFGLFLSGFWLALFDRHGQTLHDKLTRTFVVKLQDA